MKRTFLFILLIFTSYYIYSQKGGVVTGKKWGVTNLYDLGKTGYDLMNKGNVIIDSTIMPVLIINLEGNKVNTSTFSETYPNHHIPLEIIEIKFPDMSDLVDTVAALWFLRESIYSRNGIINVMLIGVTQDNELRFFADNNNNRDFTDDKTYFVFTPNIIIKKIVIENNGDFYEYSMGNPFLEKEDKFQKRAMIDSQWSSASKKLNLNLNISVASGSGEPSMKFSPKYESDTVLVEYKANLYASMQLNLAFELSYYNFSLLLGGSLEKEDYGERFEYLYIKNNEGDIYIRSNPTKGQWPDAKFYYEVCLAYNIRLSNVVRISPYIGASSWLYLNDDKFLRYDETKVSKTFKYKYAYSFGSKLKCIVGPKVAIFTDLRYQQLHFDASSYFKYSDPSSFELKYNKFYVGVGVQYRF